ncbi:MAG: cation:proton antiporter [Acholeplasmataceae bacterium]|jgi:NhaP-type Na+/H+ or K+/H+ antiporter|nr:cation:proton antiporter [Acholeplasmataceae bacterium]
MLLSISLIIFTSLILSFVSKKMKLPSLIGMLLAGILLGPFVLDVIHVSILDQASDLRQIALVVILIRAGLSLDLTDIKKIGRPAIFLSFVPALFEIIAITIFAPMLFDISYLDAAILGSIVAAVSPAVIVPRMIALIHQMKYHEKKVPHMILAGASLDDVVVIVIFSALIQIKQGADVSFSTILFVPVSIVLGALLGTVLGVFFVWFFKKFHMRDTVKVLIIFSTGFLCIVLENLFTQDFKVSGLVAIMALGITLLTKYPILAKRLVGKFEKIWVIAEIMLFVLVGAVLNLTVAIEAGLLAVVLISLGLLFRMIGVLMSLIKTRLNRKEKAFVCISYIPKATVQAAIGSIPLSLGLLSGQLILSIAIIAIIVTAPLGAFMIDFFKNRLLSH